MAVPADKKLTNELVTKAINQIAATDAGVIFFRWLKDQCHGDRSTIVGNPETFEINPMGSVCQAYLQRLYFNIRRVMDKKLRQKID